MSLYSEMCREARLDGQEWPKTLKEWEGRSVLLLRDVETLGGRKFDAGTVLLVGRRRDSSSLMAHDPLRPKNDCSITILPHPKYHRLLDPDPAKWSLQL